MQRSHERTRKSLARNTGQKRKKGKEKQDGEEVFDLAGRICLHRERRFFSSRFFCLGTRKRKKKVGQTQKMGVELVGTKSECENENCVCE